MAKIYFRPPHPYAMLSGVSISDRAHMPKFNVLCRIDAYADYVAEVEADNEEEAAELARENHGAYTWEHEQTAEFDARFYVTLDAEGREIEATHVGDM